MSTDDLTARVRDHLAHADTLPHGLAITLVSELADEVDQLRADSERYHAQYVDAVDKAVHAGIERDAARAEADRYRALWDRHGKNDLLAERDAARAALERVRALTDTPHAWVLVRGIEQAVEGES